jgi:hypothetical protein
MCVLEEQDRQRSLGILDIERLRFVSAAATEWARERAVELGCMDAKGVGNPPHGRCHSIVESCSFGADNDETTTSVPSVTASSYESLSVTSSDD